MLRRIRAYLDRGAAIRTPRESTGRPVASLDDMIPDAESASYVGGGSTELFREIGDELVGWFKAYADLRPDEKVLDVGCGIGRVAIPLTQYLTRGTYDGFDVIPHGVEWCRSKVTPRYPNFRFFHADVYNRHYNPTGLLAASSYTFPFADETFDFVLLTSVFTHMLPPDMRRYVSEIGRVLKRGGRCFCTAFIISPEAMEHLRRGTSVRKFVRQDGGYWTDNPFNPEATIAYAGEDLSSVFRNAGVEVVRVIAGGWWASPVAQDILVARKAGPVG